MKTVLKLLIIAFFTGTATLARAQVTVTIEPTNQYVAVGGTADFYATISSNGYCGGDFTGQWLFNGTNIPSIITTFAGNGTYGYSGDGGLATSAELSDPNSAAFDAFGDLYIGDGGNNVIRMVDTNGIITTVAGGGSGGGADGLGDGGPATNAIFNNVVFVSFDASGNFYIVDQYDELVRKVDTNGNISVFAGGGGYGGGSDGLGDDGPATNAFLNNPTAATADKFGNLYISDNGDSLVRKVDTSGNITIFAGTYYGYGGDGDAATNAQLSSPNGLVCDALGNLYISDSDNNVVRMVDTNGYIWTVAGDYNSGGTHTGDGGLATSAGLNFPNDVWVDSFGNIYITDLRNSVVREVNAANGIITTVAGDGTQGFSGDGGAPTNAEISAGGVAVNAGNLYIFGSGDSAIRKVSNVLMQDGFLAVQNVTTNNSGTYQVIVSSPCGDLTNSATMHVGYPPSIVSPPTNQTAVEGANVAFTVTAGGTTPLSYQWYWNGTALSDVGGIYGSQNQTLDLNSVQLSQAGSYDVVVDNSFGSVTSVVASLTVLPGPTLSTNLYMTNYMVMPNAAEYIINCTSNSSLFQIVATNWGGGYPINKGWVVETYSNGPNLYISNDPPWMTVSYYGSNAQFMNSNGLRVAQQDLISIITNVVNGTNFYASIPSYRTGTFTCIVGTNNAPAMQAAINGATTLVASGPWTNVNLHFIPGHYLMASTNILDPNQILSAVPTLWAEVQVSSGGITFLGDGANASNTVILSAGAGMDRNYYPSFAVNRDTTFLLQAPCQSYQYPLIWNNLTFDGGCVRGQQEYNSFPPREIDGMGWDVSHHAINLNNGLFNTPGYAQYNEYVALTNCICTHYRGEMLYGQNSNVGTNDWISLYNCQFLDGNATADNYNFGGSVVNCTFDGVGKVMEYYQSRSTGDLLFSNNVITNLSELAGPSAMNYAFGLTGATTNQFTTSITIADNNFHDDVGMAFIDCGIVENLSVISNTIACGGNGIRYLAGTGQQPSDGTQVYYATNCYVIGNNFACYSPISSGIGYIDGLYISNNVGMSIDLSIGFATNIVVSGNSGFNKGNDSYNMNSGPIVPGDSPKISSGQYPLDLTNNAWVFSSPYTIDGGDPFPTNLISYGNGWTHKLQNTATFYLDDTYSNLIPVGAVLYVEVENHFLAQNITNFYTSYSYRTPGGTLSVGQGYWFHWDGAKWQTGPN